MRKWKVSNTLKPFFDSRGWEPFPFQEEAWSAYRRGSSGLLHAPTGLGKTLAVWLGPVSMAIEDQDFSGCQVLWITPLRALAIDTQKSLQEPLKALNAQKIEVGIRTGDSSSYQKAKLKKKLPFCLVTTPESLSLFLTHDNFRENLQNLKAVIVDEWHELLGSKRGVQTELCITRLRRWFPKLNIWGLSATLGNIDSAKHVLLGSSHQEAVIVRGDATKEIQIETILPKEISRFPWAGHLGVQLVNQVIQKLDNDDTTLLFTNTRSQTESWYQHIIASRPEWHEDIAIHHGSLDPEERKETEERLRTGTVRCVVCTSSLDLGVDFSPVTQVIQVGSPKGIARLMQRAGRAGHFPGGIAKLLCVPTNALEILEFRAARSAIQQNKIESRRLLQKPLDVLVQHLVTVCIGEAISLQELQSEVTSSYAYRDLTDQEWKWALNFVMHGGEALQAYPNFKKVVAVDSKLTVTDKRLITMHRLSIGTITARPNISVVYQGGGKIGSVEESFLAKIKPGGTFIFGGKKLELVRIRSQKATVKKVVKKTKGEIPFWAGGKMPLSTELAHAVSDTLQSPDRDSAEMRSIAPILSIQEKWSILPNSDIILIEQVLIRGETHLFVYTFAGRATNEGLGSLVAWRINQDHDLSIQVTMNDYGFSLCARGNFPFDEKSWRDILRSSDLYEDLISCMNTAELAKRQFRDIAHISGLILQNLPTQKRRQKDLQISPQLLYEVFERYDPRNLLLEQAKRELLENQLELTRLQSTINDLSKREIHFVECKRLTPMAFPLWADRLNAYYHDGSAETRLEKMLRNLEKAAG